MIKLWTINRVVRWTGFRLVLSVWDGEGDRTPTLLGFVWIGLYGSDGWRRMEPKSKATINAETTARFTEAVKLGIRRASQ